ncbi:cytochrome P450 89A2-like [Macadamia integrifolia]|uniref:cytochrome P450 89A2-like n=1 Tax=Macadamia integrifolia TaxID=60698 RepID=UPI001C4E8A48|nr:cytochrome P450 89A2-like [Macadamia integrifolia]
MEVWFILLLSLCLCAALKSLLYLTSHGKPKKTKLSLPPGPPKIPIIGNIIWLYRCFSDVEGTLHNVHLKYGPIITIHIGSNPAIFITTHSLAYQALIENGAAFADRPPPTASSPIITCNQHTINSAAYGPLWRVLRRNFTSEIIHHSRVKSFSHARKWVLQILKTLLRYHVESGEPVRLMENIQYVMFCLLVFMCFGDKLDEKVIREIEDVERKLLKIFQIFNILGFFPTLGKFFFRKSWQQLIDMRKREDSIIIPLIRARQERNKKKKQEQNPNEDDEFFASYVDALLNLQIPDDDDEGGPRNLTEQEMVVLCSEFLNAGTDTTSTALQWIMANLVKHQETQEKLYSEIKEVLVDRGEEEGEIKEEDLAKMPYLKAVVLEGLRRHPPVHFVAPHAVTEDIVLDGHIIPKNATINFMVAQMGWDPKVWKDPMEFNPERFVLGDHDQVVGFDITGTREIKMMPFGVGRRICPGLSLAVLHLEYFVANLIRDFKWTAVEGVGVDLTEKQEFTVPMKNPLQAHISPRVK